MSVSWATHVTQPVERVVAGDETIRSTHQGAVRVLEGATLTVLGTIQGALSVEWNGRALIDGGVQGALFVEEGAVVSVSGLVQGAVTVEEGGLAEILQSGEQQGAMVVRGTLNNRGTRSGPVVGDGVNDLPGSRVLKPVSRDGRDHYTWGSVERD